MPETNKMEKDQKVNTPNKDTENNSTVSREDSNTKEDKPIEIRNTGVAPIVDARLESDTKQEEVKQPTLDDRIAEMDTKASTIHSTNSTSSPEATEKVETQDNVSENTTYKTLVMFVAGVVIGALIVSIIL